MLNFVGTTHRAVLKRTAFCYLVFFERKRKMQTFNYKLCKKFFVAQ